MNRRSYLKNIISGSIIAGLTSFSIYRICKSNKPVNSSMLLEKRSILAVLVELIIPSTDTPGAKEANVHDYIVRVMTSCVSIKSQQKFILEIEELEEYAINFYGKNFLKCSVQECQFVLDHFVNRSYYSINILNKIKNKLFGEPFYSRLHKLTVEGYCQSRLGATQGLAYDYIPGAFESCISIKPNQKSWATK